MTSRQAPAGAAFDLANELSIYDHNCKRWAMDRPSTTVADISYYEMAGIL